ncbi:MAG: nicotinamide mononucleotide transporter [Alteromonadaceae bacterium]|jgi:nicotinamide mononucleotide transporter
MENNIVNESYMYFSSLPLLELIAVVSSLIYVVLAAKGNIWCWPAALLSTVIYTVIFYEVYLWMDSALQIYYMLMAFYGWYCWRNRNQVNKDLNDSQPDKIRIKQWHVQTHIKAIILLTILSIIVGKLMATYTPTHFPYFDAATTVFAVFSTYLVTQKVLENWIYWIVIDFFSIYLYVQKELTPTAVLFILYVGLAAYGYFQWRKEYKLQPVNAANLSHS